MKYLNILIYCICLLLLFLYIRQSYLVKRLRSTIGTIEKVKEMIYYISEEISKQTEKDQVYKIILNSMIDIIPYAAKGSILILGEDGKFYFKAIKGYSEQIKGLTVEKEELFLYKANNFEQAAIIKNPIEMNNSGRFGKSMDKLNEFEALDVSCILSTPIYIEGKLIGVINVDSSSKEHVFTEEDLKLANYIKRELQLVLKSFQTCNELRHMANFDELTGVFNRRYFREVFMRELKKIHLGKIKACIVLIDLDDYKSINDTYGHITGDKVLKYFADTLRENLRGEDIYARISGDEFVVLLNNCNERVAKEIIERIRIKLLESKFQHIGIGFSYGIHFIDGNNELSIDELISLADMEMYKDKRNKLKRQSTENE